MDTYRTEAKIEVLQAWAAACCARKECCVKELREKLLRKDASEEQIAQILGYLQAQGFLDEARYAQAFVRDKSRLQGWGALKIRYALQAKDIPKVAIQAALADLDPKQQASALQKMLAAKWKTLKAPTEAQAKAKLLRFALGRGFSYEEIWDAIARIQ